MKNKLSKLLALLLAATLLLLCMTGCKKKEKASDGQITITFWHTYGDAEEAQFLNVVMPLWEAAHPDIKVEAVRQDGGQFHEMIVTSFGTGMSPDVARVDIANIASYAKQGGLVALSDYEDFATLSANYLDAPLSTNLYQGKYYGLPLDTNCKAAVVNTNVLKEIGLEEVPETMEDFLAAAKDRGTYSLNVSGVGDWDMYPYFWLFGGTLTDDGFTKATGYLDSEASIAAMKKLIELHDQKIFTIRDVDGSVDAWTASTANTRCSSKARGISAPTRTARQRASLPQRSRPTKAAAPPLSEVKTLPFSPPASRRTPLMNLQSS